MGGLPFGLDKKILQFVLKVVDDTVGKKFKVVDKLTDLFQDKLEKVDRLEEEMIEFKKRLDRIDGGNK